MSDPNIPKKQRKARVSSKLTIEEYFWLHINKNGPIPAHRPELGPCWPWLGNISNKGYGRLYYKDVRILAHVFSWNLHKGELPPDLKENQRDHLCRHKPCCNPDHLEKVTRKENILRSASPPAINARKGLCPLGHELSNKPSGRRYCKECNRLRENTRYADLKATGQPFSWGGKGRIVKSSESPTAINAAKTHCIRGHLITGVKKNGKGRYCKECTNHK